MEEEEKKSLGISVETFFSENKDRLKLEFVSGKDGFRKQITEKDLHRPGLALAGFVDLFTYQRVQICGNTEIAYLKELSPDVRERSIRKVMPFDIPCFVVTDDNALPPEFVRLSDEYGISVFRTPFATTKIIQILGDYLDEKFAPRTLVHGSLVDVYGIGVLFTGRSGIGKSEVALDLVARGHRLVGDDAITIVRRTEGVLIGMGNERLAYRMEIRGVGIIDVLAMFGVRAIRKRKRVEVQVELVDWNGSESYERLGLEEMTTEVLGERLPLVRLPIFPGKNISVIAETIALNQLLKVYGYDAAKAFDEGLIREMNHRQRTMDKYLRRDYE